MRRALSIFVWAVFVFSGYFIFQPPLSRGAGEKVPNFGDGTWWCAHARDMVWGPTYTCASRNDEKVNGVEIRLPWNGMPIYRAWGTKNSLHHALWLVKERRWTLPVRGNNIEWVPRVIGGRLAGFVLMIFAADSEKPFASESFMDPAEATGDISPPPPPSLPATIFEKS